MSLVAVAGTAQDTVVLTSGSPGIRHAVLVPPHTASGSVSKQISRAYGQFVEAGKRIIDLPVRSSLPSSTQRSVFLEELPPIHSSK